VKIDVLDKGYIELVDKLGDDLTPVNAARVSFGGRSKEFTDKDKRLSKFLIKHKHFSPFRHQHAMMIIKAPEMRLVVVMWKWKNIMSPKYSEHNQMTINKHLKVRLNYKKNV
jgi:thymidylate synthase (FAD)